MDKVWVLEATDRNYDEGSDWIEWIYTSEDKAKEAETLFHQKWERVNKFDRPRSYINEYDVE